MSDILAVQSAKIIEYAIRMLGLGAAATWPGEIALRISPNILSFLVRRITKKIIIVAGTNGKTTTSLMIKKILSDSGYTVLHNGSGANLLNGVVSSFFADWRNQYDYAVFEVDENALAVVLRHLTMSKEQRLYIVLLNLFRDQLDRYGEVDTIAKNWLGALSALDQKTTVLINGDDPHLAFIGKNLRARTFYFGLEDKKYYIPKMQHATDTIFCPSCGNRLTFSGVYFSNLGSWSCSECKFTHPDLSLKASQVHSPLEGTYNIYNTLAATLTARDLGVTDSIISDSLSGFLPAFGRMENIQTGGKNITILLSKNPTGFNESLRTVLSSRNKGPLMLFLNDRIPDGTDVSWIWDVDFEMLSDFTYPLFISGDRALDMGLRLKYTNSDNGLRAKDKMITIIENTKEAVDNAILKIKKDETMWILATYSAMLDVRKIVTGKKIL